MKRAIVLLALAATYGCSDLSKPHVPFLQDPPEGPLPESALVLPLYPQEKDLLEFAAGPVGAHRYFIDKRSLTVGKDGIVRYAMIVKAAGGAVNATYEGIRCIPAQKRIYAIGRADKWVEAKNAQWTEIRPRVANEYQATLYADFFCPNRLIVRDRDEALRILLRSGSRGAVWIE